MHERTQRAVARLLFVFTCALPTLATCWLVLLTWTPWYSHYRRHQIERDLSERLGVAVTIERIEYPAPNAIRLKGVKLSEPETQVEIARIRAATWIRGQNQNGLQLSQPELRSSQLASVWRVIHDRFLCQPDLTSRPVRLAAEDLTIHSVTGSVTQQSVDAWIGPDVQAGNGQTGNGQSIKAMLQCVPASRSDRAAFHVTVIRDRSGPVAVTDWTLQTGDLALPCSALAECLPIVRNLGAQATFTGTLNWKVSSAGWALDLSGCRLDQVELAELLHSVPHRLTGLGTVAFERGLILPGESVDLSGTLVAAGGFVGQSLLQAVRSQLNFAVANLDESNKRDLGYERLAIRFDLFGPQLTIAGVCRQLRGYEFLDDGVVLTAGGLSIVSSRSEPQSWASLVRAFWQDGRETLPVSGQSAWLLSVLPAPQRLSHPSGEMLGALPARPPRFTGTVTADPAIAQGTEPGVLQAMPPIVQPD